MVGRRWLVAGHALRATRNPIRRAAFGLVLCWLVAFGASPVKAQLMIERTVEVNQAVPDRGQYVSALQIANAGLATITDVNLGLNLSSASGTTMRLGQMYATLTFGTASESNRVAVLLNREGVTSASAFGSSLSSLNVTFDDASSNNIFFATNSTGTFAADGRLGVNPYGARVAYNTNQITAGLSALNGEWLASGIWSLLVVDTQQGNTARLNSWKLQLEGTSSAAGTTMDLGNGGTVRVAGNTNDAVLHAHVATGVAGNTATVDAGAGKTLEVTGVVSGAGNLTKSGLGMVRLAGSEANTFAGNAVVSAGTLMLSKTAGTTAISGSTIALHSGGTLLLGAANQISEGTQVTMAGGTVALGGYNEAAGRLAVTADSIFDFGTAGGGSNTFTFADFDTAGYGGVARLTFTNVGIGSKVVFSADYTGNTTFNAFTSKISFSDESLRGQISFSGGTTTLTVAAIPDARSTWAAGVLCGLIGLVELRRRQSAGESRRREAGRAGSMTPPAC